MNEVLKYTNPFKAQQNAYKYLGNDAKLYLSNNKNKKYKIFDIENNKWVHFGNVGYEDYTKHNDDERRNRYLKRALKIKGKWINNPYSPNNLSINILWK